MTDDSDLQNAVTPGRFDAVLFDLDGVLTSTAHIHAACWKEMFDEFLKRHADERGEPFEPFDVDTDYPQYVDGKPRYKGVESFLASRGIRLPWGDPKGPPDWETICGLGNQKDALVKQRIAAGEVKTYPSSIEWVRRLHQRGIKTAVVSSSRNCEAVLNAAGIADLFEARVDGILAARERLAGKPAPDTYLRAAEMLSAEPSLCVVVEDAIAGVQAGRAGAFGLVIGVDRADQADALRENGADLVVDDLGEMA